jgi:hypothetical protein
VSTRNRFPVLQTPDERAEYVATHIEECVRQSAQHVPEYFRQLVRQLRADFRALKAGETIMECRTWEQFCKEVLRRTTRAVLYIMAGGNPRSKRKSSGKTGSGSKVDPVEDQEPDDFDPNDHWGGMPPCDNDDLTAFQTIKVHFASREDRQEFAELIGQKITDQTRSIWHPKARVGSYGDKEYVDAEPETVEA